MKSVKKIVFSGLFAALACIATLLIQITLPGGGYFNFGDCVVVVSGAVLGPLFGFFSAGIGSCLADVFSGYVIYAPATFLIKGLMSLVMALIYKKTKKIPIIAVGALCSELLMVLGYFLYETFLSGSAYAALSGVPGNLMQGLVGLISSVVLIILITKNKVINKFLNE